MKLLRAKPSPKRSDDASAPASRPATPAKSVILLALGVAPFVVMSLLAWDIASQISNVNRTDYGAFENRLTQRLAERAQYPYSEPYCKPVPEPFPALDPSKYNILAFGESSLVWARVHPFPYYLEEELNRAGFAKTVAVTNLGMFAHDSYSIKDTIGRVLKQRKPDLILLYFGHNDYGRAYLRFLLPDWLNLVMQRELDALYAIGRFLFRIPNTVDSYFLGRVYRPFFLDLFQRFNLMTIEAFPAARMNEIILGQFKANEEAVLQMARDQHVPVVVVTPIGNVRMKPSGVYREVHALYEKGLGERDVRQQYRYLKAAQDKEIYTYDIRAKSDLNVYLRSLRRDDVHVFDLENKLLEQGFTFSSEWFVDYFHFNDDGHKRVAHEIAAFLEQEQLLPRT